MNDKGYDETIPLAYLNNENPYAYCTDYHRNSINMQEKKVRLTALQRMQPTKVSFRMPLKHVEREKEYIIDYMVNMEKKTLIKRGMAVLGVEYHDAPEVLFEKNLQNEEILEIALKIKKLNLYYQQKRLRFKVAAAISGKISTGIEFNISLRDVLELDNLKDALVYCKLEDLYNESS
ncbi:uncharacterized protein VICG_00071 [Vittaforma corneae ATCC 50505]|uniref:Uncharacterized protein n=1 Tax=Vittaforma corneae (strain ATCC 50505) TaxID=993615 RepID=L2GPJ6_VITCO|nr:uncharacterized protein VICG_00071 [Vittaforma corneae ATCC 50505]ELA42756.1 hypothetical protein VICG_00071 [Vittaforma corneae ATCC 50505]